MKAVVLLALLALALVLVPEAQGWRWGRRVIRRVGRIVRRVARNPVVRRLVRRVLTTVGKRDADMSEEDFLNHLATRDITDLVDVDKLTDAELEGLLTAQRETREALDEVDDEDRQQAQKLH